MQPISYDLVVEMNWFWHIYERRLSTIDHELKELRSDIRSDQWYMNREHASGKMDDNDWKGGIITLKEYEGYVSNAIEDMQTLRKWLTSMSAELTIDLREE